MRQTFLIAALPILLMLLVLLGVSAGFQMTPWRVLIILTGGDHAF